MLVGRLVGRESAPEPQREMLSPKPKREIVAAIRLNIA